MKRVKAKSILAVCVLSTLVFLSACYETEDDLSITDSATSLMTTETSATPTSNQSCSVIGEEFVLLRDDEAIADEYCEEIIDALETQDTDKLKSMFSTNALAEAEDIDEGLAYVMDFYQGETLSVDLVVATSESVDHGEKTIQLICPVDVTTDKDEYFIFFVYNDVDTENPDNVGLYMLQIMKASEKEEQFDWVGKSYIAGIWQPEETA